MRKVLISVALFFLNVTLFAQDCDEFTINTNAESTYTLCDGVVNIPFSILDPEQYEDVTWILGDEFYSGTNVNLSFYQEGSYTLYIEAEGTNGCTAYETVVLQTVEGPSSDNVTGNLISSLSNLDCLEPGTTHQVTTEITSLFTPSDVYWNQTGETTDLDHTFDVEVGANDVFNYPIQVLFDECAVNLILEHDYTIQHEASLSNPYDGSTLCEGQTITLTNTSPHPNWDPNFSWEIENAQIISETPNNVTFSYANDGTYSWQLNYNGSCPASSEEENVTVDIADAGDQVYASINSDDIEYCELPYNLNLNVFADAPSTGSLSYDWELNLGETTITSSDSETFEYEIQDLGVYNLILEVVNDALVCSAKDTITVSVDGLNLNLDIDTLYECENYTFTPMDFATNSLDPSVTYLWGIIDTDGTIIDTDTLENPSFEMVDAGTFDLSVALSSDINDCQNTILLEDIIQIYPPSIELSLGILESNNCFSNSVQSIEKTIYTDFNDPSTLITSHNWTINSTSGVNTISSTSDTIKLAFTEAGNYTVSYTATVEGSDCKYKEIISFGIGAIAEINMYSAICLGNEFTLTEIPDAAVGTNTDFLWTTPNSELIISDSNANPTTISTEVAGNYDLQLTVENNMGCTASDMVSIEAYEVDAFFTGDSGAHCNVAYIEFESLNNDYIINYTWNIHETTYQGVESNTTQETNSPNFGTVFNGNALYDVELIIMSQHGCKDSMLIEDYVEMISPLPYFTLTEPWVSCDSVYQGVIDSSLFMDSYTIDYGNGSNQGYDTLGTNTVIYTYPPGETSPSVDYQITLAAEYKFCTSSYSALVSIDQPDLPRAPFINYVTVNPQQEVVIEWATDSLVDNFNMISLYHETASNPWNLIGSSNQILPNYILHNTATNLVNNYTAVQQDSCNLFSDSSIVHSTILLSSTSPAYQTANLNWSRYYGWDEVASYEIFRSEDGAPYQLFDSVAGDILSYQDSNLCNVLYSYYVVANHPVENFQSRSNNSSIVPDFVVYTLPIDVKYTSVSVNENIITKWDAPILSDLTYYNIDRWDDYSEWVINFDHSTGSAYIDTNVNVDVKNYIYRVSYADICGNFGPNSGNIGKNILLKGVQTETDFNLTWNPYQNWDAGVDQYIIQRQNQAQAGNSYLNIETVSGDTTNYSIENYFTEPDTSYCYRVVAINASDPTIQSNSNLRCFIPKPKNYFPNAFSPNDDDINETFKYEGIFAKNINTQIYSRWGNLVYSSDEVDFEWDGKNENTGKECPQGTYIFKYELTGYDGIIIKNEMVIFLLR